MLQVVKRDGSLQPFDQSKIVNGLLAAGLDIDQAREVSANVEDYFVSLGEASEVSSLDIRDRVISEVEAIAPEVAEAVRAYTK